jgi:hypothetical protein
MLNYLEVTAAGLFLQHNTHVGNDSNPTERLIVIIVSLLKEAQTE